MNKDFKLKHLVELLKPTPDITLIMTDVCGFRNNWIGRKFVFTKKVKEAYKVLEDFKTLEPKKVLENPDCKILRPSNIDHITFMAMLDTQSHLSKGGDGGESYMIGELIAKVCFSENYNVDYDTSSKEFIEFREKVLNQPLLDMLGLFNWIDEALEDSTTFWNQRFLEVEVEDIDLDTAGGGSLSSFNVVNSIKQICNDFNLTLKDAWQISYTMSQTNSLAKASERFIQDRVRILKESKMKASRRNQQ